jgi:arylsulfatase A-like enzyme
MIEGIRKKKGPLYSGPFFVVFLLLLFLAPARLWAADAATPNIVLILADDLGWGDLSVYGADKYRTPNCDRLADEGIRFTDAHAPSAVCSPTRYGVLTGRYAWRTWLKNGILLEHMPLLIERDRLTLPEMLRRRGYKTACIGKWHLGWGDEIDPDWNGEVSPGPLESGFEYFFGLAFSHASSPEMRGYVENRNIVGLEPGESIHVMATFRRLARRMDLTATTLTEKAVQFIRDNREHRFFLYLPATNVHRPWSPAWRFRGKSGISLYGDYVVEFDWMVGEILDTLEQLDLSENTMVLLTSDNGARNMNSINNLGHFPNGPWSGSKGSVYEAGHRVPFIVRWPGHIRPGTVSDETICLTDIMATCAAIVDFDLPDSAAEDSYDLTTVLTGAAHRGPLREATVHHSVKGMFAIRQGRWKLIEGAGSGSDFDPDRWPVISAEARFLPRRDRSGKFGDVYYDYGPDSTAAGGPYLQLFDLERDPAETTNVYLEHPDVVQRLQRLLDSYRDTGRSR